MADKPFFGKITKKSDICNTMETEKKKFKMQQVSFRSVDEFLDYLPPDELAITEYLRKIVLACMPDAREKLSFNVPYYSLRAMVCFIWPASITWGKKKTYEGVRFGFAKGYLMEDDLNYLDKGNRKKIYWRDFQTIEEIDVPLLKTYLQEAILIDEFVAAEKQAKKATKKNVKS
jgi:hypothetical protein